VIAKIASYEMNARLTLNFRDFGIAVASTITFVDAIARVAKLPCSAKGDIGSPSMPLPPVD
jgi:hypothetical protein